MPTALVTHDCAFVQHMIMLMMREHATLIVREPASLKTQVSSIQSQRPMPGLAGSWGLGLGVTLTTRAAALRRAASRRLAPAAAPHGYVRYHR